MSSKDKFVLFMSGAIVGAIFFAFLQICIGITPKQVKEKYQQQAIENNCAQYDSQTGEWMWEKH